MGPQFHESQYGQRFFNKQLPDLIKAINRLADAVEEANKKNENKKYVSEEDTRIGIDKISYLD